MHDATCWNPLTEALLMMVLLASVPGTAAAEQAMDTGFYFPRAGRGLAPQAQRTPEQVGLKAEVIDRLSSLVAGLPAQGKDKRWALWRHGFLVHAEGDFDQAVDVASLRKTWHAMIVGAALKQGKIPSLDQPLSEWLPELQGNDARATWRDVLTQASGFDYPYGDYPDYAPGEMWTYSDWNPRRVCDALAKVYGRKDFHDNYAAVAAAAYFDALGMQGWSTRITFDAGSRMEDGVRFVLSLEHMGRLGLLALARGTWNGIELVPRRFVEQLETKQTHGMRTNYRGPTDGMVGLDRFPGRFAECPYGFLTWVNTESDYFPGADPAWAWGSGAGGCVVLWNRNNGLVFAGVGTRLEPSGSSVPHVLEQALAGPNPLVRGGASRAVGQWDRFEGTVANDRRYADPYNDVELEVVYSKPDGTELRFRGFHDGGNTWRFRCLVDQLGTWRYAAAFSDGAPGVSGSFLCVVSDLPGMIAVDGGNPIWFGFRGGRHTLIRGFHVGDRFFAANWPAQSRTAFLDWAQGQGYNLLSIASHYLNRDEDGRGRGWETPKLWPLNAGEYQRMEAILDDLARRRLLVYPFAGFFGKQSHFPTDPADQERFIRYTLARLGAYWHVLFVVAGPEPNVGNGWLPPGDVHRLAQRIRDLDPFGHLLSVHNRTGDDVYRDAPWASYGILQGPKTVDRQKLSEGLLRNHGQKPLLAQETLWSGNKFHPPYTDDDLKKNAWVINLSAAGLVFADMSGDSSSGFSGSMDLSQRNQPRHEGIKRVWDFLETVPYWRMRPRQDLVTNGYCLADEGYEYLVYLQQPGRVHVTLPAGAYAVEWINGSDTADRRSAPATTTGQDLGSPTDGDDWLLHLVRQRA